MRVEVNVDFKLPKPLKPSKKTKQYIIYGFLGVLVVIGGIYIVSTSAANPIPKSMRSQISFATAYPRTGNKINVDSHSFSYDASQKTLAFTINYQGVPVVVTERPVKGDSKDPSSAFYHNLGLHPVAEINTKYGLAVVVNFYEVGTYAEAGQDGVLVKNGTLLIAKPKNKLSNEQWKNFFNNLKM